MRKMFVSLIQICALSVLSFSVFPASQQVKPAPQTYQWLEISILGVERAKEYETFIILPNGKKAVLTAAPGKEFVFVHVQLKALANVTTREKIVIDHALLFDNKDNKYESTTKDFSFYPALEETKDKYTFDVPEHAPLKKFQFGGLSFDISKLESK